MLNFSHISVNESPINSPPLSENIFLGAPKIAIQCFINTFGAAVLLVIIAPALYLANSSIMCKYQIFFAK